MSPIHLACAADERYAPHCAAMLHSAFTRHDPGAIFVHFLHGPQLTARSRNRIARIANEQGGKIAFHEIPDSAIEGLPTVERLPGTMWYRIFLPELLPELTKVLYLDADTLVLDSLEPLWQSDLRESYLAAVTNVFEPALRSWPQTLGLAATKDYFNSGVLLMNLEAMRRDGCTAAICQHGRQAGASLRFPDQDSLNAVLASRRCHLHPRWNCMNGLPFYSDSSTFFGPDAVAEAIGTPAIVHFEGTGAGKPWHFLNSSPHREIYYRHLRASGWPPQLPEGLSIGNVARRYLPPAAKKMLKSALSPFGYGVSRRDGRTALYKLRGGTPPPAELTGLLRDDHPRLSELRQRYGRVTSPLARHSIWTHRYLSRELQLPFFRGDNAYMWQQREVGHNAGQKHAEYAEYVARRDPRGLLNNLGEDGAFGCLTFSSAATGSMSRDLLDSVNELYFLDRNIGLFQRTDFSVLDIGAGYGRMAHRMSQAVPSLSRYVCADAVAESTYLSEIYLNHRRCSPPAMVVALDELDQIRGSRFDLAINIHSFSEMPHAAVRAWLELLAELRVPRLLIVPNDEDLLLTYEPGGSRIDFMPVLTSLGFKLQIAEPIVIDAGVRARTGLKHHFMLFEAA